MSIIVGKTAGFCFGVKRAVDIAYQNADKNVCTLGPLIHNKFVIQQLEDKGVQVIKNIDEANNRTVIIRAHGIPKKIYQQLEDKNVSYIDCTCPFVKKIHSLVEKNFAEGRKIIITGDPNHAEVIGINGYADNHGIVIQNVEQAKNFVNDKSASYSLVSQTTFSASLFDEIAKIIQADNVKIYNTICNTTEQRQLEAKNISRMSDKMIVIGDKSSSNSTKLYDVCRENCSNTFFIQNPSDLLLHKFNVDDRIGVMAGASTPLSVIKEAVSLMNQVISEEKSFAQLLDESFLSFKSGDVVQGHVVQVYDNEIILDFGYKSDGIISKNSFSAQAQYIPNFSLKNVAHVGDSLQAVILKIDDGEGNVILSKKRLEVQHGFKILEKAYHDKSNVTGKIVEIVRGGLIALTENVRLFVPTSCLSSKSVGNLESYIGKTLDFKVIEFDRSKRKCVGSHKAVEEEQDRIKSIFPVQIGDKLEGVVTSVTSFGLFVDIGCCTGLVHRSEINWSPDKYASEEFKVGDRIRVRVLRVDPSEKKVYLTMKSPGEDPWANVAEKYPEGKIVEGQVARITNYGAFVTLERDVDGLLHISKISNEKVEKISDKINVGEVIKVRVLSSDPEKHRISLSMIDVD